MGTKLLVSIGLFSVALIIFGIITTFSPYLLLPTVPSIAQILWEDNQGGEPKAVIQFTFTSKGAFTVNYPIHTKVEIWFREKIIYNNIIVHILKPPAQAFKYPLTDPPDAGLIKISEDGYPRVGELDVIFTSQGPYGFVVLSGVLPEMTNRTVAYVATDKEVIRVSPYQTRLQVEYMVRGAGITGAGIGITILKLRPIKGKNRKEKQKTVPRVSQLKYSFLREKFNLESFRENLKALDGLSDSDTRYIIIEKMRHQATDLPFDKMPHNIKEEVLRLVIILKKEIENEKMKILCLDILHIITRKRVEEINAKVKTLFLQWIEDNYQYFPITEKNYAIDILQRLYRYNPKFIKGLMLDSINKWSSEEFGKLYREIEFDRLNEIHVSDFRSVLWKLRAESNKMQLNEKVKRIDAILDLSVFR